MVTLIKQNKTGNFQHQDDIIAKRSFLSCMRCTFINTYIFVIYNTYAIKTMEIIFNFIFLQCFRVRHARQLAAYLQRSECIHQHRRHWVLGTLSLRLEVFVPLSKLTHLTTIVLFNQKFLKRHKANQHRLTPTRKPL